MHRFVIILSIFIFQGLYAQIKTDLLDGMKAAQLELGDPLA